MSLTEDHSSSCVHTSAKPAVPEHVGQRFAVINMASKYETQMDPQPTDTLDAFAGSETSLQVKPYFHVTTQHTISQPMQSTSQREPSLGDYLFNLSSVRTRDLDAEWDVNLVQLEPMTDAQSKLSSFNSCLLPIIPCNLKKDKARALYTKLKVTSSGNSPTDRKGRKYYTRISQLIAAHHGPIWTSEFSQDMSFFATAGQDGSVKIWKCLVKTKTATDAPTKQPHDGQQPPLDTSTLIHSKVSEPLPPICENFSKECLSQNTGQVGPNRSSKPPARKLSKATIADTDSTNANTHDLIPVLKPAECEDKEFDESTSSLSDEKPYGLITTPQPLTQLGNMSLPDTCVKVRPAKAQFSQLSLTVSQHSTPQHGAVPSSAVVQLLTPNKLSLDFPNTQSAPNNDTTPFFLPALRIFREHTADVISCSWSHSNFLATGSLDRTVKIWSPIRGSCLESLCHDSPVTCVLFHPLHEKFLYTATSNGDVYQWDIVGKCKISWSAPQMVTSMVFTKNKFSPSAGVVIVGTTHGKVYILVADSLRPIFELQTYTIQRKTQNGTLAPKVLALSVIDETNELLVSMADAQIKRYCLLSMLQVKQYRGHTISGILGATIPRIMILKSSEPNCEKADEEGPSRVVVVGDDKGSIYMYLDKPPQLKSLASTSFGSVSRQGKIPKQKACTVRGVETVKSCLKVNLPQRTICTSINIIQSNGFTTNARRVLEKNLIVVTTANGAIICIDV